MKHLTSKHAFTLVELLVVISIISMLASIVIASTASVQAKGRDSARTQQIRQIDLATRLYIEAKGYAPFAGPSGLCQVQSQTPGAEPSACFAVSTPGVDGNENWQALQNELSQYMPRIPVDPCGSNCISLSGYPIGYTYVAPLAMQYFCAHGGGCTADNYSYQLYAPLERGTNPSGSGSASGGYYSPNGGGTPPPSGLSLSTTHQNLGGSADEVTLTWTYSGSATQCDFSLDGAQQSPAWGFYNAFIGSLNPLNSGTYVINGEGYAPATGIFTCTGPGGTTIDTLAM